MTSITVGVMFWLAALSPFEPEPVRAIVVHCVDRDLSNSGQGNSWAVEYCEKV